MSQFFTSDGQSIGVSASASANEYSRLISFRIDRFDLPAVQGTLKSLLQHHSSKVSMLSLLYGPTLTSIHDCWENHSFDYTDLCDFSKVMSLLFNMLSRLVKALRPKTISNSFFLPKTFLQGTSAF